MSRAGKEKSEAPSHGQSVPEVARRRRGIGSTVAAALVDRHLRDRRSLVRTLVIGEALGERVGGYGRGRGR